MPKSQITICVSPELATHLTQRRKSGEIFSFSKWVEAQYRGKFKIKE